MSTALTTSAHAVLIPDENDEQQAILLLDSMDLDQAMAEIRGEVLETFVYVVRGKVDRRTGEKQPDKQQLAYAGVREAARLYKNVKFGAKVEMMPDGSWLITAYAHNLRDNITTEYPWPYPAFDSHNQQESINFRATVGKATRNALAAVLPVAYLNEMIRQWLAQKKGERIAAPPAPALIERPGGKRADAVTGEIVDSPAIGAPVSSPEIDRANLLGEVLELLAADPDANAQLKHDPARLRNPSLEQLKARLLQRKAEREDSDSVLTEEQEIELAIEMATTEADLDPLVHSIAKLSDAAEQQRLIDLRHAKYDSLPALDPVAAM